MNYNHLASVLDRAAKEATAISQISAQHKLNLEEAYAIQSISLSRRYERGESKTGLKLGFTSKAKMEQMGVHDLIWGKLTDQMHFESGASIQKSNYIHPRAEPEIAFKISNKVDTLLSADNYLEYIDGVAIAIEIIDSRYENFKFSLEDVIADNCSSTGYVIGDWHAPTTKIQDIEMNLCVDDQVVQTGNSNAILGNPIESLYAASRLSLANGELLSPGHVVLAGAATSAVYIEAGNRIMAEGIGLGKVLLNVI